MTTILAIETSCDETAAAVIENGDTIRSNVVATQMESHARFGGVVPEIASRHHVEVVTAVVEEALEKAKVTYQDLTAVAVTEGPGLVGALLVGIHAAKAIAFAHGLPLIGVHHIAGHIYANQLVAKLQFPLLALVVSGGHTELIYMEKDGHFQVIGQTRDDAVGEAYDKVARALALPYPGGPNVEQLADTAEATLDLPRSWLEKDSYDFSFSGLKSAVLNRLNNDKQRGIVTDRAALAKGFQESVVDVLVAKTVRAQAQFNVKQVVLAGGVAANKGLRKALTEAFANKDVTLLVPPLSLCTDNAAMIGACAHSMWLHGISGNMAMNARPGLPLSSF
ncbi:tRNA (adenosine(37)-N6)-threonylcarbamoyltransferase complex transferase subunit TsaD [Shouchella clausii]|uniref:tRNA (adenosine(37)-N6)-threonylcarbamoyltransferase complex transferase subunit TsaD n=1 Tax=Shouchella clausii TaxID=79880 RepID=UPI000B976753|nr:tRNA (adenosine(37)-N6)-threonylcarbamoyltransferase complex transferase subunit TsaD [Shouchella clausii]PAD41630.1 tRNA (adenosine(37)-N6)-threonylcarbamoyltransferase complex transferase subunit TsaD [Bacillus sp. 7520-S]AST94811.1 tRNA (adenosine(37)-N6)-threonylcarbamoyltransferase complex transferase subunit TsaD [Shouchella clausii]MBU8597835.1 tRNA (adenosine(37)-N6)-threonylcarbamoyltransferase complex transferase subunit TsaD [Shouchella clausii]MCR1289158.1 tRNA (adenosine(37)-N6)